MLGPSGCGKTTTLRMIAGFETPDEGRILLQGADVTHVPPPKRNVNMVFQAYGLFPHMTVAENIAFGPKIKKLPRDETRDRVAEASCASCASTGSRTAGPGQLSGGQQQRVALARALVNRPAALLLDEPLGALDLKLRKEMQLELKDLQQRTGTTFVYVTHDQEEAMTMSDRIAVMNGGVVEQLATPRELYQRPASAFVAGFIGTSNLIELRVDRRDDGLLAMDLGEGERILAVAAGRRAPASRRPAPRSPCARSGSSSRAATRGPRARHVGGTVIDVVYLGSVTQLIVLLPTGERLTVHRLNDEVGATDPRPGAAGDAALGRRAQLRRGFVPGGRRHRERAERPRAQERRTRAHDRDERGATMATDIGSHHRRADRRRFQALHAVRLAGAVEGVAARDRPRRGRLHVRRRRPALARLQLPAHGREHRPRRQARHRSDRAPGREASLHLAVPGVRGPRRARRKLAELWPGDIEKTFFTLGGRRGERERGEDRQARHGTAEGDGALPQLPRFDLRHDDADGRSASLAERAAGHARASCTCSTRTTARSAGSTTRQTALAHPRGDDRARGAADDRGLHPRDGRRHERRS